MKPIRKWLYERGYTRTSTFLAILSMWTMHPDKAKKLITEHFEWKQSEE